MSIRWNAVYYANWRANNVPPPSSLKLGYVSHVFYAFAWVKEDGTVYLSNEWVDEHQPVDNTKGYLRALVQQKRNAQIKVLLSIGGSGEGSSHFAAVTRSPAAVEKFMSSAAELANKFDLDGFDINWEHPKTFEEGKAYTALLFRLRQQFPSPRYLLTTALPAGAWALCFINLSETHPYVDLINLMTYDFSGPWTDHSGHHAQLYAPEPDPQNATTAASTSCSSGVSHLMSCDVPSDKILLGIPVYGRAFPGVNGINKPYKSVDGKEKEFDYHELPLPGTEEMHDDALGAAYCVDSGGGGGGGAGFISYDSTRTVRQKAEFVSEYKLGGLFYWHLAADAGGERSLVATGYQALHSSMI
ncbi:chitinase [[Emmonsia] crescens]|uniref:chitinase n=1 Tax=[Emmonsia] crescens TaxID=73230 RepID=A0A0G2J8G4_9EURO|nr:chitinase [Emmonsia crescens UAMH 3008]